MSLVCDVRFVTDDFEYEISLKVTIYCMISENLRDSFLNADVNERNCSGDVLKGKTEQGSTHFDLCSYALYICLIFGCRPNSLPESSHENLFFLLCL